MNAYEKEYDEQEFQRMLDENYDEFIIMGVSYGAGYVLRRVDPIAFRCAMADEDIVWVCAECESEFDEYDDAEECCTDE